MIKLPRLTFLLICSFTVDKKKIKYLSFDELLQTQIIIFKQEYIGKKTSINEKTILRSGKKN